MSIFIDLPINDKGRTDQENESDEEERVVTKAIKHHSKLNPLFAAAIVTPSAQNVALLEAEAQKKILLHTCSKMMPKVKSYEKMSAVTTPLLAAKMNCQNAFLATVHEAFANERPIVFAPDHIWLLIAQAVAIHVNENAEKLRGRFVQHEGKMNIIVRNDQLRQGAPNESPWEAVFPDFVRALDKTVVGGSNGLVSTFSTTGNTEGIASVVTFMDTVKAYFTYTVFTRCGIPRVTLLGTVADWQKVRNMAEQILKRTDMYNIWWSRLGPVLDEFVALANGNKNVFFWEKMYKDLGAQESGEANIVTGWFLNFFPYVTRKNNTFALREETQLSLDEFPSSLNCTPFVWDYFGTLLKMKFCAGGIGIGLCSDNISVTPSLLWSVAYE